MKVVVKLLFSAVLIYFVFRQIDTKELINILKSINISFFLISLIFYTLSKALSAVRLNYYFKEIDIDLPLWQNLRLYFVGMFYNLFLPGGIGGDGYKAYLLKKYYNQKLAPILKALLFDRVSGLIALIFLAMLLFVFSQYAIISLKYLAILGVLLVYPIFFLVSRYFNLFMKYFNITSFLGIGVQLLQLLSAVAIIYALPQKLPLIEFLVLFLISSVVAVLPLTIGGVGIRELTFLYGLNYINVNASNGVAFSFLFFIITMLSSLIGLFFLHNPIKKV